MHDTTTHGVFIAIILGAIAAGLGGLTGVNNLREDCIKNDYLVDETDADIAER